MLFKVVKNTSFQVFPHRTQKEGEYLLVMILVGNKQKFHFKIHNLLNSAFQTFESLFWVPFPDDSPAVFAQVPASTAHCGSDRRWGGGLERAFQDPDLHLLRDTVHRSDCLSKHRRECAPPPPPPGRSLSRKV